MKRNRSVKFVLFILVVFLIYNLVGMLTPNVKTQVAVSGTMEKTFSLDGVIIRDEYVMKSNESGVLESKVAEYEMVKKNKVVAINYIGLIDKDSSILKDTFKTSNADWFKIDMVDELAYDHNKILEIARENLKKLVLSSNVLKSLFPSGFTMPELLKTYESILNKEFDRRNFRKKILSLGLIKETNKLEVFNGKKPAKKYEFNDSIEIKEIL